MKIKDNHSVKTKILDYYNLYSPPMVHQPRTVREIAIADEMRRFHKQCIDGIIKIVEEYEK